MRKIYFTTLILIASSSDILAQNGNLINNLRLGYQYARPQQQARHILEAGYYRATDNGAWGSWGPSISALAISENKELYPGAKIGYEFNMLFLGVKIDTWAYQNGLFLSPGIGLSFIGFGNINYGYNFSLLNSHRRGSFLNIVVTIPMKKRDLLPKIGG